MIDDDGPKPFKGSERNFVYRPSDLEDDSGDESVASSNIDSARDGFEPEADKSEDARDQANAPNDPELRRLGADLAQAVSEGGYHPVVLFGTNFSGKTSLLLSLFSTIVSEPGLRTGLALCDSLLGSGSRLGRLLHEEADHTFSVKTQAFMEGEKIPKTAVAYPFFVPVEFRPEQGPDVRFAFLESNGEWYRPNRNATKASSKREALFPALRTELEDFISTYQGAITFLYLVPYTQGEVYEDRDQKFDADEIQSASLAITGVLRAYDRVRANCRGEDQHLMLVTKWDARNPRDGDRAGSIEEDPEAVRDFCNRKYAQAVSTFQGVGLRPDQRHLNAYCSGIINERGLLQLRHDDDVRTVVTSYPVKLWAYLYKNALVASDQAVRSPFPVPPPPPFLVQVWSRILEFVSGGIGGRT